MKTYKILTIIGLLSLTALTFSAFRTPRKAKAAPNNGFALVELFTSEGCSSCPPADELVAKIVKEDKNLPVYVLAYHVDYWNSLGWKDQFSSAEYSSRQRQYAGWLKLESVYTPQIVVNGKTEFVGSNESSLRSAVQNGLQKANNDQLTIDNASVNANQLTVQYETKASSANRDLLIAFVQKNGRTDVKRGENGGRVLNHVNIVREMNSISLKQPNGTATVKLPRGYNAQGWEVIGFLQNISNGEILSAQKVVLSGI